MSLLSLSKRVLGREKDSGKAKKPKASKKKKTGSDKETFASVPGGTAGKGAKQKKAAKGASKKPKKEPAAAVSLMAAEIGLHPIITERSVMAQQNNVVVFQVRPSASKHDIKIAVKEKFGVQPLSVRTATFQPKTRRRGRTYGRTNYWKKAYVKVDDIQKITTTP